MALHNQGLSQGYHPGVKDYLLATRPQFLVASLLPVLLGTAIGYHVAVEQGGGVDFLAMVLALGSVMFINLGINVLNDVYDDINGTDRINHHAIVPFTGGSRVIQENILTQQQMRQWSYLLLSFAAITGFLLFLYKGYPVLLFGLAGLVLGITYSMPPFQLASRGLGELAIALGCGILPVLGAAWLQSGAIGLTGLLLSIPAGLWVANIVIFNELPDAAADGKSGKRTLTVRFGDRATAGLYLMANLIAVAIIGLAAVFELVPFAAVILPLLFLIPKIFITDRMREWKRDINAFTRGIRFNIVSYVMNLLWLAVWVLAG